MSESLFFHGWTLGCKLIGYEQTDKHFINDPTDLVMAALKAAKYANPSVALDEVNKIIYRKSSSPDTVALVSGGGAGHEPSFTGYFLTSHALHPGD